MSPVEVDLAAMPRDEAIRWLVEINGMSQAEAATALAIMLGEIESDVQVVEEGTE